MTILNVWASSDRVLIGTDTKCGTGLQSRYASKVRAIPHAACVVAGRGLMTVLNFFMIGIEASGCADFDSLVSAAEQGLCERAVKSAECLILQAGSGAVDSGCQQLAMAGWSEGRGRMGAVVLQRLDAGSGWVRSDIEDGDWLSAWDASLQGEAAVPSSIGSMELVARAQVAHQRKHFPEANASTGGRLIVAEVTKEAVSLRRCCQLT